MNDTRDLTKRLTELLRREQGALADFLVALADFDRERRWVELGHTSLFCFLHRELGLSKGAAFYRKTAAELIQRYPEVVEPLRNGKLCITSVVELAKVITPENRGEVVARFFHTSKREAKAVAAELRPAEAAPHRDVVTVPQAARHSRLRLRWRRRYIDYFRFDPGEDGAHRHPEQGFMGELAPGSAMIIIEVDDYADDPERWAVDNGVDT